MLNLLKKQVDINAIEMAGSLKFKYRPNGLSLFELWKENPKNHLIIQFDQRLPESALPLEMIEKCLIEIQESLQSGPVVTMGYEAKATGEDMTFYSIKLSFLTLYDQIHPNKLSIKSIKDQLYKGTYIDLRSMLDDFLVLQKSGIKSQIPQTPERTIADLEDIVCRLKESTFFNGLIFGVQLAEFRKHLLSVKERLVNPIAANPKAEEIGLPLPNFKYHTHQVAWLHKLGVIDALKKHYVIVSGENGENETYDFEAMGDALRSITGIGTDHCRKMVEAILAPNKGNAANNPTNSRESKKVVAELSAKYGLK